MINYKDTYNAEEEFDYYNYTEFLHEEKMEEEYLQWLIEQQEEEDY